MFYSACHCCTHIAQRRAAVVPNLSKRNPLASVRKLFIKEAMVKTRENCSSCPLQSVDTLRKRKGKHCTRTSLHEEQVRHRSDEVKATRYLGAVVVRTWHWPSACVALTPVALTHRELKKPSVFRTKTSEAHPNTAPAKHRHSTRPEAKVKLYLTLMVPKHSPKCLLSLTCTDGTFVYPENFSCSAPLRNRKVSVNFFFSQLWFNPFGSSTNLKQELKEVKQDATFLKTSGSHLQNPVQKGKDSVTC